MITTPLRIDLIVPCMGMKRFTEPEKDTHHDENFQELN